MQTTATMEKKLMHAAENMMMGQMQGNQVGAFTCVINYFKLLKYFEKHSVLAGDMLPFAMSLL